MFFKVVKRIVRDLKINKAVSGEIPTCIIKECEFTFDVLIQCVKKFNETGHFPHSLKLANAAPVFQKDHRRDKSNYRPVSNLPFLSKVYGKVIYNQWSDYSGSFLNNIYYVITKRPQHATCYFQTTSITATSSR